MATTKRNQLPGKAALPALDAPETDAKLEFFLTASHQLKSPVAIIQWCLQSVEEMQTVSPEVRNLVQKALTQADGMSKLIQDMLQVFRLMKNQAAGSGLEAVNINKVVDEICTQYELVAHNKGVHLVRGAIENLPAVYGKEILVHQAIMNLVDNAIKYTKPGGHVTVSGAHEKHEVVIHVKDEGIGIPDPERSRLFTEFFRGEEAKEIAYEGTGLGLVLVKHIVESMGGSVSFHSEFHKGTDFYVKFPLHHHI
jgi:signal transduction histidine kinase